MFTNHKYTVISHKNMEESNNSGSILPSTDSSQQLMPQDSEESIITAGITPLSNLRSISARNWFTVIVLCFVNLINYMDRFTIAGVLTNLQKEFSIGDDQGGLLQTVFILSYMVFAPLFGYFGDRHSRKLIMAGGVFLWSATTAIGSVFTSFSWFLIFRALVGIGEASYSTIAPTIISDLFINDLRSKMLALFYFAIPVGSGLGYIIGSETAELAGSWRWALRVTPFLGILAVILLFIINEPEHGHSEGSHNIQATTYKEDLKYLLKNPSFMLVTAGFTCVTFVVGALAFWAPKLIYLGLRMQPGNQDVKLSEVSFIFGAITMLSGLIGVPLGSFLSQILIKRYPTIDPVICGSGLFISVPLLAGSMIVVTENTIATYLLIFLGEIALNMNWAIVADVVLYVVIPTRRSTAEAFQILISHAFGDAGSPAFVGIMSEAIKRALRTRSVGDSNVGLVGANLTSFDSDLFDAEDNSLEFRALQYSLFSTSFIEIVGAVLFLVTAMYIVKDKHKAAQAVKESRDDYVADNTVTTSESS